MLNLREILCKRTLQVIAALILLPPLNGFSQATSLQADHSYEYEDTRALIELVKDASELIRAKGEFAFNEFRINGSRWRKGESYIFVLDPMGNMSVHLDPEMEGKNEIDLKDINGKAIVRGLIGAAMTFPDKPEGWYHYEWPIPGGLLPRWKSSYVRLVTSPSGSNYIVGSGTYNDRIERTFVVDTVKDAVAQIEKKGRSAFPLFHDSAGPFISKDTYIFVVDSNGNDLVNPAFPNLEGRNLLNLRDTQGKQLIREMFKMVESHGSGWVDYMWPKPGDSSPTQKSAYVSKTKMGDQWVLVGSGVYLSDAPKSISTTRKMSAAELMTRVREGAQIFEKRGEKAYPEFRKRGSKWLREDAYFFVWTVQGDRVFHAANPSIERMNVSEMKDVRGRPIGKMILGATESPSGEGWVHYMYPEPGNIFPTWKSTFVKRVTFPSGREHVIGSGIYNMQMDRAFIEDVVNRAANLVERQGRESFSQLRDRAGPFVFMDTYIFVDSPDGTELVNAAQPSLEGKNLIELRDLTGKLIVRDEIAAAMKDGSAWLDLYWFKPGQNRPALKKTFVRRVQSGQDTYIVGSGMYPEE
jgi:signal transduction histidine kinase